MNDTEKIAKMIASNFEAIPNNTPLTYCVSHHPPFECGTVGDLLSFNWEACAATRNSHSGNKWRSEMKKEHLQEIIDLNFDMQKMIHRKLTLMLDRDPNEAGVDHDENHVLNERLMETVGKITRIFRLAC